MGSRSRRKKRAVNTVSKVTISTAVTCSDAERKFLRRLAAGTPTPAAPPARIERMAKILFREHQKALQAFVAPESRSHLSAQVRANIEGKWEEISEDARMVYRNMADAIDDDRGHYDE